MSETIRLISEEKYLAPRSIQKLAEYHLAVPLSSTELAQLGLTEYTHRAFSLLSFDKEPHYLTASIIAQVVAAHPDLASSFAGSINLNDVKLSNVGGLPLDKRLVEERLTYLKKQGVINVANDQVSIADVDLILRDYLHAQFGEPIDYDTNVVSLHRGTIPPNRSRESEIGRLIMDHMELVRRIAFSIKAKVPKEIDLDDMISEGNIGLMEAARRYDPKKGIPFKGYAKTRIRGQIHDYLRKLDFISREDRRLVKKLEELAWQLNEEPTEEIALSYGLTSEQYRRAQELREVKVVPIDFQAFQDSDRSDSPNPELAACLQQRSGEVWDTIEELDEKKKTVLTLYYQEGRNFKEIGEILGVTESRICQIHWEAIRELQKLFEGEEL